MFRRNGVISCNKGCKADEHGDTLAGELIARTAYYPGVGMANLINLFNPERIVIGGGEEDDVKDEGLKSNLYTTPEDMIEAARRLNSVKGARYLVAATFGNVHGAYKPGHVKLKTAILKEGQNALEKKKAYDPRAYLAAAEISMAERVKQAVMM